MSTTTNVAPDPSTAELACPLCGYSLRGLTEPRCPECGFAFTWAELLDERRDRHPYLFEHARRPAESPTRALVRTALRAGLRPWRFWRDVSPTNPVRVRRLVAYWVLLSGPLVLLAAAGVAARAWANAGHYATWRASYLPVPGRPGEFRELGWTATTPTTPQDYLDRWFPHPWTARFWAMQFHESRWPERPLAGIAVMAAAWPWLTAGVSVVFRRSMRRVRIDARHALRTAVYAGTVGVSGLVVGLVVLGPVAVLGPAVAVMPARTYPRLTAWSDLPGLRATALGQAFTEDGPLGAAGVPIAALAVVPFAVVTTARSAAAYRRYVRVDRPLATAVAVQTIVVLVVVVATLQLTRAF